MCSWCIEAERTVSQVVIKLPILRMTLGGAGKGRGHPGEIHK